jgi:hypothetical protein
LITLTTTLPVSTFDLTTLLNYLTYDDYGLLKRKNETVSFELYSETVRDKYDLELSDEVLELGYYFIRDLWNDNERYGNNNPDGTFKS